MARKASMWAKAAGEYYRKNKGKNGIESFSDVLKSSDFKAEYHAKYGKQGKTMGRKGKGMRNTKRYRGGDGEQIPSMDEVAVGGDTTASVDPVPANTTSSLPATPAATAVPEAVMGGKRKGSKKRRTAKKSSYKLW